MHGRSRRSQHFLLTIPPILSSINPDSDPTNANLLQPPKEKRLCAPKLVVLCTIFLGLASACEAPHVEEPAPPPPTGCGINGAFEAILNGGIETEISWSGSEMDCSNMQRPNDQGIRLRFSGEISEQQLVFIIALTELKPAEQAVESPANVTVTIEGSGLFFSTPDLNACWAEIESQTAVPDDDNYTVRGALFCITPLGQINGNATVSVSDLSFTTLVEWNAK